MKTKKWLALFSALVLVFALSNSALAAIITLPEDVPIFQFDDAWELNQVLVETHYPDSDGTTSFYLNSPYTPNLTTLPANVPHYSWDEYYEMTNNQDIQRLITVVAQDYDEDTNAYYYNNYPVNLPSYEEFLRLAQGVPDEFKPYHDPLIPVKMAAVKAAAEEQMATLKGKLPEVEAVEAYAMSNRYIFRITAQGKTFYQVTQGSAQRGFKSFYTRGYSKGTEKIPSYQMIGDVDALLGRLGS